MNVPPYVPHALISSCVQSPGCVVLCESVCAIFHTSLQLPSFSQNYLICVGLSWLRCLYHDCASHSPP
jgi:hypothetical protein